MLPSAFGEAFPNVLCEAMACGTPCVATDVGDSAVIIGDTGEICPPSQPVALASALHLCAERLKREADLSERSRARIVENFSLDRAIIRYTSIWAKACRKQVGQD